MRNHLRDVVTVLLVCGAILALFASAGGRKTDPNALCVQSARTIMTGLAGYVQDYDETFPPITSPTQFASVLFPYTRSDKLFFCPATSLRYTPNYALSGLPFYRLPDPDNAQTLHDTEPHADGKSTVAFLDGHVERGGVDTGDPEEECIGHAGGLSFVLQMYAQDYDGVLPSFTTPKQFEEALHGYAWFHRTFRCPATQITYRPNYALSGMPLSAFPHPETVLVIEDVKDHADGKRTFGYLDGHVERR